MTQSTAQSFFSDDIVFPAKNALEALRRKPKNKLELNIVLMIESHLRRRSPLFLESVSTKRLMKMQLRHGLKLKTDKNIEIFCDQLDDLFCNAAGATWYMLRKLNTKKPRIIDLVKNQVLLTEREI